MFDLFRAAAIDNIAPDNKIRPDYLDLNYDGRVYRINSVTGETCQVDRGICFTNGVVLDRGGLL